MYYPIVLTLGQPKDMGKYIVIYFTHTNKSRAVVTRFVDYKFLNELSTLFLLAYRVICRIELMFTITFEYVICFSNCYFVCITKFIKPVPKTLGPKRFKKYKNKQFQNSFCVRICNTKLRHERFSIIMTKNCIETI